MVGTQGETSVQQALSTINANGSPMSIVAWGEASGLDSVGQQHIRPGIYTTICGNTLQEIHFKMSKNTVANRNHTDVFFGATSINTLQGFIKYTSFITKNLSSLIQIHTGGAM
jgi:hypothetical protein